LLCASVALDVAVDVAAVGVVAVVTVLELCGLDFVVVVDSVDVVVELSSPFPSLALSLGAGVADSPPGAGASELAREVPRQTRLAIESLERGLGGYAVKA
jgi:hypothetical protein